MRQKLFIYIEKNNKKLAKVLLNKYLKRSISVGLVAALFFQAVVINDSKVSSKESSTQKNYIIECMSDGQYDRVQKLVGDNDVVLNDEIERILEDNSIQVVSLSESEVKKIQNTGAVIEEDIVLKGSITDDLPVVSKEKLKKQKEEIFGETGKESEPEWNVEVIGTVDAEIEKLEKDVVKIAIIDSGVDYSENINVVERMNFFDGEVSPLFEDNTGHGTAIAGIIASDGQNGSTKGINPDVDIYSARVLDRENKAPVSRIIEAIYWAIDKKVNIMNISFGTTKYSEVLHNAIKDAKKAGILIFAASGNEGESANKGTVEYPAAFEEVVSVGATDPSGEVANLTSRDGGIDIVAPGIEISSEGWLGLSVTVNGTSMAVPHAVGAASLLWQKNLNKSADFIESLLKASSKTVVNDGEEYSFIDLEYADTIYDEFSKKYKETEKSIEVEKLFDNEGVVEDCSDEVEGSWSRVTHRETVDYSYNTFNTYYNDVPIVKLGATAPDDYCPFGQYPSHEMFHAKSKYAEHNYVRVCEYIMNLATHCKRYGHQSALSANCKPDSVNDPDYNTVKSWLGPVEITVMLNNQFSYNDYNAALIMFGVAIHVMGDTYAHQALEVQDDGSLEKPQVNDVDSNSRLYYAKQSIMNLWTNFYNNIKTNGTDYEGNGNKFKLKKLYSYSIASTNGKSESWSAFNDLKKISCRD